MAPRWISRAGESQIRRALSRRCFYADGLLLSLLCATVAHRVKIDAQHIDLSALHRLHGKDRASRDHPVPNLRQTAKNPENKSTDCCCIFIGNVEPEPLVELADVRAS